MGVVGEIVLFLLALPHVILWIYLVIQDVR